MLTPRRRLFSNKSSPTHTPFSQAPTLRTATSSTALVQPGLRLRIKRSLTFLRPVSRTSNPPRPVTHLGHNDEAVRLARTQFLEQRSVQKRSSLLHLPKIRPPQKAFRKSVRSSQLRETDDSVASDTPSLELPSPAQSKRSFSASLRDRVLRALGKSVTNKSSLPPQQLQATRQHFSDIDEEGPSSSFDKSLAEQDDGRRESFYVPSKPDPDADEEKDRLSPTLHTAGSRESLHSNARSRVTSWTNSSMTSSTIRVPALERNPLSIIREDGGPHEPSCSAGRHIGGISAFQDPLETENVEGHPFPPVDSQRIYSALMKRISEEEAEIEQTKAALEEIHQRSYGHRDPFDGGKSTIRAVSSTTFGTEAAGEDPVKRSNAEHPEKQDFSSMILALHKQNVERHKVKLALQEEQSSFFPFSDQGKAQTPSPFRKLLEQKRSEGHSEDGDDQVPLDENERPVQKLTRGRFGLSSESIYSQTTNGGDNPSYVSPIGSSEELATINQEVDEDTGMATIIPARYRASERPKLPSADSTERRKWKGWMEGAIDASLGRRDYSKAGIHYREHAQIDSDDVQLGKDEAPRPGSKASSTSRFPLLDLKEVPRNNPAPKRSSSLTKSQSELLKRASSFGLKPFSERNDENKQVGSGIRKLSPGNLANMLKERKSQMAMARAGDADKENKPVANNSPRSSSPAMSTPGRLGLQMRSGNGRLRKRASDMADRSGQKQQVTPKNVSTPLRAKVDEHDESPTDRVKHSLSARLKWPFKTDVPELNRPFDGMFLGRQEVALGSGRPSTASNAASKRPKGYGGLGPSPFDGDRDDTALPQVRTPSWEKALIVGNPEKSRFEWSSKRMVSDFLRKRRLGRSASTEDGSTVKKEGERPAFV